MKRNTNINLVKIIATFMIILVHIIGIGGIKYASEDWNSHVNATNLLFSACLVCVNLYALVAGYVSHNKQHTISNFLYLWLQVVFYDVLLTILCSIISNNFTFDLLINSFLPLINNHYWFFNSFFPLTLLSPLIVYLVDSIENKINPKLILFITIMPIFIFFVLDIQLPFFENGYSFIWLLYLFVIGKLLKDIGICNIKYKYLFCVFYIVFVSLNYIVFKYSSILRLDYYVFDSYNSFPILIASISLFVFIINLKINEKLSTLINHLSLSTFSIYLIHCHPILRILIIDSKFWKIAIMSIWKMMVYLFIIVIAIFIVCLVIDQIRIIIFKNLKLRESLRKKEISLFKNIKPIQKSKK